MVRFPNTKILGVYMNTKRLKKIILFSLMVLLSCLLVLDSTKSPSQQYSSQLAISGIELYQEHLSGKIPFIRCRYKVTCSEYTKRMIQKHGIFKGSLLSITRIIRCI